MFKHRKFKWIFSTYVRSRKNVSLFCTKTEPLLSNIDTTLKGLENQYMYQFISKNLGPLNVIDLKVKPVETYAQLETILGKNYRINSGQSATDIVETFKLVSKFSLTHNIPLSDSRFDNLVDGLMDHCENLTDEELLELLYVLAVFPKCDSYTAHNFHDVWSCLNDISCDRIAGRDMDYLLKLADAWYQLDLGKIGEYIYTLTDFSARKAHKLTKEQLLKIFFFLNVCRRRSIPFEFEDAIVKYLDEFNIDELGLISLGYFKSQSKIKISKIVLAMIQALVKESSTVKEITLSSLLKGIRYSKCGDLAVQLNLMLDALVNEIDRLNAQCCLQVAILGTTIINYHPKSLEKCIQKLVVSMDRVDEVRLKDIERILNAVIMLNHQPKTRPELFKTAFAEIHKNQRKPEMGKYPRILATILHYFAHVGIYSNELMDLVLDPGFIKEHYGNSAAAIPREIFFLNSCIDVDCPDYQGNRLSPSLKYRSVKWLVEFPPSRDQFTKITAHDKLFLDVMETVQSIVGEPSMIRIDHVAPHFPRADIILCKDKRTNKFVEPPGFQRYILGDLKYVVEDPNLAWYAIMVIGWNNTIRNTYSPVGLLVLKERHLKKLGYKPQMVIWNQYMLLSRDDKVKYLNEKLR